VIGSVFLVVSAPGELRFLLLDMLGVVEQAVVVKKRSLSPQKCAATREIGNDSTENLALILKFK
jgi:hypothetical protein